MGVEINATLMLLHARKTGVSFENTLTLGRQHMPIQPEWVEDIVREAGVWPPPQGELAFREALAGSAWPFETFARALGAATVDSIDVSSFEGATLVHDLNQPIPPEYRDRFSLVIDGGTLEHVFNFPVAIANCMNMVRVGGHLILITPANNYCGHGFYQFSPELFYRVLSRPNGFEIAELVAFEARSGKSSFRGLEYPPIPSKWFSVADPAAAGRRVELINHAPTLLMVIAKRVSRESILTATPQQSDYVPQWQQPPAAPATQPGLAGHPVRRNPGLFRRQVLPWLGRLLEPYRMARLRRSYSFRNRDFFRKFKS